MSLQRAMSISAVPTSADVRSPLSAVNRDDAPSATGQREKSSGTEVSRTGCITITRPSVPYRLPFRTGDKGAAEDVVSGAA